MATGDIVALDEVKDPKQLAKRLSSTLARAKAGESLALVVAPFYNEVDASTEPERKVRFFVSTLDDPTVDQAKAYIERLMPEDIARPEPAVLTQLYRNVTLRVDFLETHETWDAGQVADFSGSTAKNKAATAARWRSEGLVFAVDHRSELLYPAFQFDLETRRPKTAVAPLLQTFAEHDASGWEIALWLTNRHPRLRAAPVDMLDEAPERVLHALRATYEVPA